MSERIRAFPADGERWWIRWVDGFFLPRDQEAGRQVHVVLSKIPARYRSVPANQLPRSVLHGKHPADEFSIPVSVGMIPRLVIGGVFRDGRLVDIIDGDTQTFSFERANTNYRVLNINPELWAEPSDVPNVTEYLVPKDVYPLHGEFQASSCVSLESNGKRLLVPCFEVLRQWFCPQQTIAHAIFGGPWRQMLEEVFKTDQTGKNDIGEYEITVRSRIHPELRDILASLYFSYQGQRAASNIYTQLLARPSRTKLRVGFPFEWNNLDIEAQCVQLKRAPPTYLALRLTRMSSPWAGETIGVVSQHASWRHEDTPTETRSGGGYRSSSPQVEEPPGDVVQRPEPHKEAERDTIAAPTLAWFDASNPKELERAQQYETDGPSIQAHDEDEATEFESPGPAGRGQDAVGRTEYLAIENAERIERFEEVVEMLNRLEEQGAIQGWHVLPHPEQVVRRGSWPVWRIPARQRNDGKLDGRFTWPFLDKREMSRQRSALVCQIETELETVIWIELERREEETGFRYIVFRPETDEINYHVFEALKGAAYTSGSWPHVHELVKQSSMMNAVITQHTYVGRQDESGSVIQILNEQRAHQKIVDVIHGVNADEYRKRKR